MGRENEQGAKFKKNPAPGQVDYKIKEAIEKISINGNLACEEAARIASTLDKSMAEVGSTLDVQEVSITKCQLGLFGYQPNKIIVSPAPTVDPKMEEVIRKKLVNGCLPCEAAWEIANAFACSKIKVASACETLSIKIKPCQLGAF
jgi:hypothetical protein